MQWVNKGLLSLCILSIGCGTWIGNPKDPDEGGGEQNKAIVNLDINSTNSSLALTSASVPVIGDDGIEIGTFVFEKATIVLKAIELASTTREDDGEIDFEGPYVADLLTDTMTPPSPSVEIAAGFYDRIKLKMEKLHDDEVPAGVDTNIIDRSVYLSGTYSDGSITTDITMTFELSEEFELRGNGYGLNFSSGQTANLLIEFDLAAWLDFSNVETNEDGFDFDDLSGDAVVLSEDSAGDIAKSIHNTIKENIKESAEFAKDEDRDGEIEDDELETEGEKD